jgi:hypothetical protein
MRKAIKSRPRRIAFYALMFLIVLVVLALPIWLGFGPVVHSQTVLAAPISN